MPTHSETTAFLRDQRGLTSTAPLQQSVSFDGGSDDTTMVWGLGARSGVSAMPSLGLQRRKSPVPFRSAWR